MLIPPGEHAPGEDDVLEILRFSVFQKLTSIIAQEKFGFVIRREYDSSSVILVHQISQAEPYIQGVIQKIRDSIFSQFGVALVVGIGETVLRRDDLQQAYNTAHKAAELYYFTKQDTITYATSISEFTQDAAEYHTCYDACLQSLLTQRDDVVLKLQTLLHVIFKLCYADRKGVENHCIAMAMEIFHELVRYGRLTEDDRAEYEQFVSGMRECSTFDALAVYVVSYFSSLNTRESNRSSADAHDTILAAKAYVQAHYDEDLNLQTVAQKVYMNPYYFSAFFKKETGENFKSFVMRVRMTKALELIQTANLKTYELAQRVGYHDVRTFTENFKEFYGETPSACKKRLR